MQKCALRRISKVWFIPLLLVVLVDTTSVDAYVSPGPVDLGTAANFAVLANTAITNTGSTVVSGGDVGSGPTGFSVSNFPPGVVNSPGILYTAANAATANANTALGLAYSNIAGRTPDQTFPNGDGQLNNLTLDPGVYRVGTATTAQLAAGNLTLDANNDPNAIWIFQIPGTTLKTAASTQILLARQAQACNVYWQVGSSATLGASSIFRGNILADTSITVGNSVTVIGRLLAGAVTTSGAITLDTDTITKATCVAPAPAPTYTYLTLIKTVINDNGGTKLVSDFQLFIGPTNVTSNLAYVVAPDTYQVRETSLSGYTPSAWGGACSPSGVVTLAAGENKTCTITNDDVASAAAVIVTPPLISIKKLPNPLALPSGPGLVTYTYTVLNVGTVAIENVTVVDNKCSPVTFVSGDTNANSILGTTETWIYRCSKSISETTTNSATVVGYANGISATDIAFATVVVGTPKPPPLINVIKTPSALSVPFGGGSITYTYKVTNPGVIGLDNVSVVDDRCINMSDPSGDTNGNNVLGIKETWTFTCTMRITRNTVNTVTAKGSANGLTAIDYALATVLVRPAGVAPGFPNTGIGPEEKNTPWNIIIPVGLITALFLLYGVRRKQIH